MIGWISMLSVAACKASQYPSGSKRLHCTHSSHAPANAYLTPGIRFASSCIFANQLWVLSSSVSSRMSRLSSAPTEACSTGVS